MTTLLTNVSSYSGKITELYIENGGSTFPMKTTATSVIVPAGIEVLGRALNNSFGTFTGYTSLTDVVILSKSLNTLKGFSGNISYPFCWVFEPDSC